MKNLYNLDDWKDISCHRLGEIMIEAGKINLFHISMVLDIQRYKKMPMGEILLAMKVVSKKDLEQALIVQKAIQERRKDA